MFFSNHTRAVENRERMENQGMGNGKWRMRNGEWRMRNGEWGTGNGERGMGIFKMGNLKKRESSKWGIFKTGIFKLGNLKGGGKREFE